MITLCSSRREPNGKHRPMDANRGASYMIFVVWTECSTYVLYVQHSTQHGACTRNQVMPIIMLMETWPYASFIVEKR